MGSSLYELPAVVFIWMLFPSVAMVAPAPPSSMQLFVTAHPEYSEYLSVNVPLAYDGVTDDMP